MNLHGLTDRTCRKMLKAVGLEELEICDGESHRSLAEADAEGFVT